MVDKNPLHDAIYNKVVRPALKGRSLGCWGVVMEYDDKEKFATVKIWDKETGREIQMDEVHVGLDSKNQKSSDPENGDIVWVQFMDGDRKNAFIVDRIADKDTIDDKQPSSLWGAL